MKICARCGLEIRGYKKCCPLCQGKLREPGETDGNLSGLEEEAFPVLPVRRVSRMTCARMTTFLCLAAAIAFGAVGVLLNFSASWPFWTMLGIFVGWVDFLAVLYLRSNLLKLISVETLAAILITVVTDFLTGQRGWAVAWVWPFAVLGLTIVTFVLAKAQKLYFSEYVMYFLLDCVAAFLQVIPLLLHADHPRVPAILCMAAYLILMAAILLFGFHDLKTAASRRFHL